eukprot:TRINITY_DN5826_c0_g1_i4.p2 TRINITY_DN5826_c0_g1~~TRINITY_DN5826_c0_g1_i4.p2  ORF type:complete len:100 (-),score=4.23 TRINITY_DN5826_c0_g1_i4:6-305(-)
MRRLLKKREKEVENLISHRLGAGLLLGDLGQRGTQETVHLADQLRVGDGLARLVLIDDGGTHIQALRQLRLVPALSLTSLHQGNLEFVSPHVLCVDTTA